MTSDLDLHELAAWLRLLNTPSLGRDTIRRLLAAFGSAQAVLDAPHPALSQVGQPALIDALAAAPRDASKWLGPTMEWLGQAEAPARTIIVLGDNRYPHRLLESSDPPLLLYAQGRVELLMRESIAVVGSRNPTAQGLENARAFAAHLSRTGLTVVSGLATGIDGAAHDGALDGHGSSIAVIGTGIDRVYPRRHLALAHRLSREGLVLSEFPLGAPPLAGHFPQRNRIIAGLALGTLVVEAAPASGSLITAKSALDNGREVFAIPGSIHAPQSRGCNALIKQGAKLVESAEDILEELQLGVRGNLALDLAMTADSSSRQTTASPTDPVLDALGYDPMSLDELVSRTGWPAHELNARMLDLELEGRVVRLPGQLFQRLVKV